ncbi:TonB-dependent siderophore receptor [Methylophaga thiooxydans]|uniref:TonB-dependent siderophore receptor n=1 Tax=Methylophaga thiooxydans TaxID=392484 RepID=UPI0023545C8C|nr:TonB-dependent siderophore receptor [Methylophaga thiooxydans]
MSPSLFFSSPTTLSWMMSVTYLGVAIISTSVSANEDITQTPHEMTLPEISVSDTSYEPLSTEQTGAYNVDKSRASTKLKLDVKETPQAFTAVTNQQMDDFSLNTINDVLNFTPSVNVEQTETDRTYYTARGFSITNFQVDSLAIPTSFDYPLIFGDVDTVTYDRIEVLRGANGLLAGTGNPAATVNYVRKRPTSDFQASMKGLVGSWDRGRFEGDISGSLNEAETVRGRFVAAYEDKNSYLDRYSKQREVVYGVMDFQLSDSSILTVGHTYQKDDPDGVLWGSLPLVDSRGDKVDYSREASTSQDWTYWTNETNDSFIELKSDYANGWQTTTQLTRVETQSRSKLFYIYGTPSPIDGSGLVAYTGKYDTDSVNYVADAYASGPFSLAGREHELVFGGQWAKSDKEYDGLDGPFGMTNLNEVLTGSYAEPAFGANEDQGEINAKQRSVYSTAKFNLSDDLNLILGTRYINYSAKDTTYGKNEQRHASEWVPYVGTVYSLTDRVNAYASYTEIFQPQSKVDINNKSLDPAEGKTYEVGLKMDFNEQRALATMSLFKSEQNNVAEVAGTIGSQTYYASQDGVTAKGIELDVSGEVAPRLQLIAGYTYVDIEDAEGERTKYYIPKQTIKLASTYQFKTAPKWKMGANVRWQSDIEDTSVDVKQDAYSVWGAMVSYQVSPQLKTALNLYNLFDEKYYTSFYGSYGQSYYAAPRSATLSLEYDF